MCGYFFKPVGFQIKFRAAALDVRVFGLAARSAFSFSAARAGVRQIVEIRKGKMGAREGPDQAQLQ